MAMQRAYRRGWTWAELQYLEAHATATQVGDATELTALSEVLKDRLPPGKKIPITSVKANIGHTLETAGLAGVIKTVLCMQHGVIPPAINVRKLNPKIDWDHGAGLRAARAGPLAEPPPDGPRRAGVNAFGIGGLNMHVVLDAWTPNLARPNSGRGNLPTPPSPRRGSAAGAADAHAVAVVGMGCIFPGAPTWRAIGNS